jgi:ribonuclease HI
MSAAERPAVVIVTDGACQGNPGPGGWAALIRGPRGLRELSGGETATTNNRMEMMAALRALEDLEEPSRVELTTDSQYLRNGITSWIHGWMRKGWRTSTGGPVKNEDLWRALWEQAGLHDIQWRWVRGHAGHVDNERCDRLAVAAAERARRGDTEERRGPDGGEREAPALPPRGDKGKRPTTRSAPMDTPTLDLSSAPQCGRNLELKFPHRALDEIKRRAGTLGGKLHGRLSQDDQFYAVGGGERLKLRRETRHLPDGQAHNHAELIRYTRADEGGPRLSAYELEQVGDPDALHERLVREHGLDVLVRKGREVVLLGRTRLHLDTVAGLGTYVELELVLREGEDPQAAQGELEHLVRGLGLFGLPAEPRAYADLLRERLAITPA